MTTDLYAQALAKIELMHKTALSSFDWISGKHPANPLPHYCSTCEEMQECSDYKVKRPPCDRCIEEQNRRVEVADEKLLLISVLKAVLELHKTDGSPMDLCITCSSGGTGYFRRVYFPCPTAGLIINTVLDLTTTVKESA